jgi:hypothetical protein
MKTANWIIKLRWPIIIGFILLTALMAIQIPNAEIEPDLKEALPKHMKSKVNTDKIEEIFGGNDMIMVLFETDDVLNKETLTRVKKISKKLNRVKGVDKVLSLFDLKNIYGQDGAMIVDPAVKRIPKSDKQKEQLRESIINNEMVYETVVSEDFKYTSIIAKLDSDAKHDSIINVVDSLLTEFPGNEIIHKGGDPYLKYYVQNDIAGDMALLIPVALILMLIMLFIAFRRIRGVLLPFAVVIMSIVFGLGLMPVLGWKLSAVSILMPIMIIAIANDYGIHLVSRYQEMNTSDTKLTIKELAIDGFMHLKKPIIITGITTIAGMLGLLSHIMIPAKQLGIIAAVSIAYALILSLIFIPAVLSLLKKSKPVYSTTNHKKNMFDRWLEHIARFVTQKYKAILLGSVIITVISSTGIILLDSDSNMVNFFPQKHPVKISTNIINDNFGGSQNINVLISGDIKSPDVMKKMDYYESQIINIDGVGNVTSIAKVIREISKAMNDEGDKFYDAIPDTREAIAQYFELYSMSGDPDDFEQIVDFDYKNAILSVLINKTSSKNIKHIVKEIKILTQNDENVKIIGGAGIINTELESAVVGGQTSSLLIGIVVIALIMMIIFRSVRAGLLSSVPLIFALVLIFGLMGYFAIKLDVAIAMLSSIMIGVGVDYTIHFLWRYKSERINGLNYKDAVIKTLTTTGKGIIINALSVIIGFTALLFSVFMPIKFFGFLIVISIFACLVGALIIIPAMVLIIKPKFLEPKTNNI